VSVLTRIGTGVAATALVSSSAIAATGDRAGLALLDRVHRAYAQVPGVSVSGQAGQLAFRWTLVLDSGITVGEQFVAEGPGGVSQLVVRRSGPTYARDPGSSCWRALRRSDQRSFDNIGLPFPDQAGMRVEAPRAAAGTRLLPVVVAGDPGTFSLDGSSRVRSITVVTGGRRIFERVTTLRSAPALTSPDPRC
jgi:hypothetical protein